MATLTPDTSVRISIVRRGMPSEAAAIRAKPPKALLLVDDRGVYGVLEQVGVDGRAVPVQPGRHAEIDPDHVLLRVCPDIGAAIAVMPEARPGDESTVTAKGAVRGNR